MIFQLIFHSNFLVYGNCGLVLFFFLFFFPGARFLTIAHYILECIGSFKLQPNHIVDKMVYLSWQHMLPKNLETMRNQTHEDFKFVQCWDSRRAQKNKQAMQLSTEVFFDEVEKYPNSSVWHSLIVCITGISKT